MATDQPLSAGLRRLLLLPGFLGLDAPVVIVFWIALIAATFEKSVDPTVYVGVFLAVWAIYLADRIVDVAVCKNWNEATDRLIFGKSFRVFFSGALSLAVFSGITIAVIGMIPVEVIKRALVVAVCVAIYFGIFVMPPTFLRSKFRGKEIGVGLCFAGGVVAAIGFEIQLLPVLAGFGIAVIYNCLLIAARDKEADGANDPGGASQWWPNLHRDLVIAGWICAVGTVVGAVMLPAQTTVFVCLAVSFFLMNQLHAASGLFTGAQIRGLCRFLPSHPNGGFVFRLVRKNDRPNGWETGFKASKKRTCSSVA